MKNTFIVLVISAIFVVQPLAQTTPRQLLMRGHEVNDAVVRYIEQESDRLNQIRSIIQKIRDENSCLGDQERCNNALDDERSSSRSAMFQLEDRETSSVAHPINALHAIRNWADVTKVVRVQQQANAQVLRRHLVKHGVDVLPNDFELDYAKIPQLQHLYNISTSAMIAQLNNGSMSSLAAEDMTSISGVARQFGDRLLEAQWLASAILVVCETASNNMDAWIDQLADILMSLTIDKRVASDISHNFQKWIHVEERNALTCPSAVEAVIHGIQWPRSLQPPPESVVTLQACSVLESYVILPESVHIFHDFLRDEQLSMTQSFIVDDDGSGMNERSLKPAQRDYIHNVMENVIALSESVYSGFDIKTSVERNLYSFEMFYAMPGLEAFFRSIQTNDFAEHMFDTGSNGLHIVIFITETDEGAMLTFDGSQAIRSQQNTAVTWMVKDTGVTPATRPKFCPALYGKIIALCIYVRV